MTARSVFAQLPGLVGALLPVDIGRPNTSAQWSYLIKLYYGNADLHYEASHRPKLGVVEIGLHFEADDLTNARLLGAFRGHERAIKRELPNARFEEWDRGWTRIWESVACPRLDAAVRDDLAERLARYIAVLEPILRAELPADVPWSMRRVRETRVTRRQGRSRIGAR